MEKLNNGYNNVTEVFIPDNEVIARVIAGEKHLYALLIKRYNQRLYRVCIAIVNNDTVAEELLQTTYIKAWENLEKFAFKSSFSTWLTRILINESLQWIKKQKKSLSMKDDIMETDTAGRAVANSQSPLSKLLQAELKAILEDAICTLPEKYRTVFVMRQIEEMSVAETQACLGLSEANVKVRLNRARTLLREKLSGMYNKEELLQFHLTRCEKVTLYVMKQIGLH
jgi:RNA polymerase sigma factor (sigma-70 family)